MRTLDLKEMSREFGSGSTNKHSGKVQYLINFGIQNGVDTRTRL